MLADTIFKKIDLPIILSLKTLTLLNKFSMMILVVKHSKSSDNFDGSLYL
jgi:hypothetical protein